MRCDEILLPMLAFKPRLYIVRDLNLKQLLSRVVTHGFAAFAIAHTLPGAWGLLAVGTAAGENC